MEAVEENELEVACLREYFIFLQQDNGTFNGAIGDIIYRRAHFTVNGFFVKDYLSKEVEFSSPSYNDKLCIIVQSASRVSASIIKLSLLAVLYRTNDGRTNDV